MKAKEALRTLRAAGWRVLREGGAHHILVSTRGERAIFSRGSKKLDRNMEVFVRRQARQSERRHG